MFGLKRPNVYFLGKDAFLLIYENHLWCKTIICSLRRRLMHLLLTLNTFLTNRV